MKKNIIFIILNFINYLSFSQINPGDCVGAIPVCKNIYNEPDPYTYKGEGAIFPEIAGDIGTDCKTQELNGMWYLFTIQESGMLRFSIKPNNDKDDYDWIIFDLTHRRCEDIFQNTQQYMLSSNNFGDSTNVIVETGANSLISNNTAGNCNGPGVELGPSYNDDIPVRKGGTYVLYVSNWSKSEYGFTIDFSESTAVLFDNVKPEISYVSSNLKCNDSRVSVIFSEQILCSYITEKDFSIISPSGKELSISRIVNSCTETISSDKSSHFILDLSEPLSETGEYTVSFNGYAKDACDNRVRTDIKLYFDITFDVSIIGDSTVCEGNKISLRTSGTYNSYLWNTGEKSRSINISESGIYTVQVTTGICEANDKHEVKVTQTKFYLGNDTVLCNNLSAKIGTNFKADNYLWNTGEKSNEIIANQAGEYILEIEKMNCKNSDTIRIEAMDIRFDLGKDTVSICPYDSISFTCEIPEAKYIWNTGDTLNSITVNEEKYYLLRINKSLCKASDSVFLQHKPLPGLEIDTFFNECTGNTLIIEPQTNAEYYFWNQEDYSYSQEFTDNAKISITAFLDDCFLKKEITVKFEECPVNFIIPNVFTPNKDGKNDLFTIKAENVFDYRIEIYNRWGQLLFESEDINISWNGDSKGVKQNPDTYYYIITHRYGKKTGFLNLFR